MAEPIMIAVDQSSDWQVLEQSRALAAEMASFAMTPVRLAVLPAPWMNALALPLNTPPGDGYVETIEPQAAPRTAPMSSAEFVYREDGRPDWAEMWTNFCDLALYGGPPHRGEDTALHAPVQPLQTPRDGFDAIAEIRRGIWETTGLFAEPAEPGWIAVSCSSKKMAAWLCACIILENVEARCEHERLFVPASQDFALTNEVKSVITVLAKTHHYWQAHVMAQAAVARG